ncbi:MAG TPA: adenine phosphoribosyltransferase [Gemmatimonadaceae bacterium]|nr:adenine phosphoribosyltransferase [Gemmatimonadaceae bacterium]
MTPARVSGGDTAAAARLRSLIRDIPDFPKPGIVFRDITPLLADARALADATRLMADPWRHDRVDHVVGIESRGFILGACVARELGVGFVPVRKPGKLPHATSRIDYALEYGTDALEVHTDAVTSSSRVLIVDDVLATGGTAAATCQLLERIGAHVVGLSFLMVLEVLQGRQRLDGRRVSTIFAL